MNRVYVHGLGAISPAGWTVADLHAALVRNEPIPCQTIARPGWQRPLQVRAVPKPSVRPAYLAHARLRRSGLITQHAVGAALEAVGRDAALVQAGTMRLGIILCVTAGGVSYSRRFYEEVMKEPASASPLIFPETVFNAPASHLAAFLGASAATYTLVGDEGAFLQSLALAAGWLLDDRVDGVVVVGAEEMDWIVADAIRLFQRSAIHGEGAGALYLKREAAGACAELAAVTDAFAFTRKQNRTAATGKMLAQLPPEGPRELWCASGVERNGWKGAYFTPKTILGQAFNASTAWQCVAGCEGVRRGEINAANVSVVGTDQQAIGARFAKG